MLWVIISFVVIIFIEVPEMLKKRQLKELITFFIFTSIALILSTFFVFKISIFNPVDFLNYIIKDLLHLNYK
jgi:hypothetical protein